MKRNLSKISQKLHSYDVAFILKKHDAFDSAYRRRDEINITITKTHYNIRVDFVNTSLKIRPSPTNCT